VLNSHILFFGRGDISGRLSGSWSATGEGVSPFDGLDEAHISAGARPGLRFRGGALAPRLGRERCPCVESLLLACFS